MIINEKTLWKLFLENSGQDWEETRKNFQELAQNISLTKQALHVAINELIDKYRSIFELLTRLSQEPQIIGK